MRIRRFLFYSIFFLVIIFFFFYLNPPDTLIQYVPSEADLYFHLNLNKNYLAGYQARNFLKRYQLNNFSEFVQKNFPKYTSLLKLVNKENINKINELAFFVDKNNPVLIFRLKNSKENINIKDQNVFSFTDGSVIFFTLDKNLLDNVSSKKKENFYLNIRRPILKKRFVNNNFLSLYLKPNIFQKLLNRNNLSKLDINFGKIMDLNGRIYEDRIVLFTEVDNNLVSKKKIDKNLIKFIPNNKNVFAIFNFSGINKFLSPIISENIVNKTLNNLLLVSKKDYVFIFKLKHSNLDEIKKQIKINLSYVYPREVKRTLPDMTKITELVADPDYFKFKTFKRSDFEYLKTPDGKEFFLAKKNKFVFLSNNASFLKDVFLADNSLAYQRVKDSDFNFSNNLFYTSFSLGFSKYILGGYPNNNFGYYLINIYY